MNPNTVDPHDTETSGRDIGDRLAELAYQRWDLSKPLALGFQRQPGYARQLARPSVCHRPFVWHELLRQPGFGLRPRRFLSSAFHRPSGVPSI